MFTFTDFIYITNIGKWLERSNFKRVDLGIESYFRGEIILHVTKIKDDLPYPGEDKRKKIFSIAIVNASNRR